jgi:predicted DNA-binding ribbon-helix-helix protein
MSPMPRRPDRHPIKSDKPSEKAAKAAPVRPVKRSFRIAGHPTSISLEAIFWDALKAAAAARGTTQAHLVAEIDAARGATNLSSAVRVWLFENLQRRAGPDVG